MKEHNPNLRTLLTNINRDWTLFLDRDGVINQRVVDDYVREVADFIFLPHVLTALARLSTLFGKIFIITNQQGIGKGFMTEQELALIHQYLLTEVGKAGGKITRIYYEPGIESPDNERRKPQIGMGLQAKKEYPSVRFEKSLMVGDSESDILFGKRLGMKTIKIGDSTQADYAISSLYELVQLLPTPD